ncbi:MAG: flagellar motor switch protein FliG, partial [Pseudomonadota bacterium]
MPVDLTALGLPADLPDFSDTGGNAVDSSPKAAPTVNLRQREKAAIIVRLILSHGTRLRLADLPADLQKQLARDVSSIRQIDQDTLTAVVEEFLEAMGAAGLTFGGGIQEALTILDGSISATAAVEIAREE